MVKTTILQEISELKTDFAVLNEKVLNMGVLLKTINKAISGNGQPGLVQKLEFNENKLEKHLIDDTNWKSKKDGSIFGIKWAITIGFSILGIAMAIFSII